MSVQTTGIRRQRATTQGDRAEPRAYPHGSGINAGGTAKPKLKSAWQGPYIRRGGCVSELIRRGHDSLPNSSSVIRSRVQGLPKWSRR